MKLLLNYNLSLEERDNEESEGMARNGFSRATIYAN